MRTIIVETPFGRVAGDREGEVLSFRRVRYAPAPTGERRFAEPGLAPRWSGLLDATKPGPIPPQLPSRLGFVMGEYSADQNEDCLHLDIWTRSSTERQPVLVFIHGGAFMTGGGSLPCYDGASLAAATGLVVVNISYRIGALGFLTIPGLPTCNLGLHDQIAALRWIRTAIAAFGGDASSITVIGQSAGSSCVAALLARFPGGELFDRAIIMSGPLGAQCRTPTQAEAIGSRFLAALGLSPGQLDDLHDVSIDRILSAQLELIRGAANGLGVPTTPFSLVFDDHLIPEQPLLRLLSSGGPFCPTLIGWTSQEFVAFFAGDKTLIANAEAAATSAFVGRYGERGRGILTQTLAREQSSSHLTVLERLRTAEFFAWPTLAFATTSTRPAAPCYVYRFDWSAPDSGMHACHCIDLPFLFGNLGCWSHARMLAGADPLEMNRLVHAMQQVFASFAATGNPNDGQREQWPPYKESGAMLIFGPTRTTVSTAKFDPLLIE